MSQSGWAKAAVFALSISSIACGHGDERAHGPQRGPSNSAAPSRVADAEGEVVGQPVTGAGSSATRWITDANALSLVSALNAREIAAADMELDGWHVDTARAFAASMAREHADLQHSIDSLAAHLDLTPVAPALAQRWAAAMQAQIDTMRRSSDGRIDLSFVHQQVNSHQRMADYLSSLAAVAEHPE